MASIQQILNAQKDELWSITPDFTAYQALEYLAEKNTGAVPVVDNGKLVGIFSERDYARKVILKGKSSKETPVSDLMTRNVYFINLSKTVEQCMLLMTYKHIRHLPVMENGTLIGMVTMRDVVKVLIEEKENAIRDLETYITGGYGVS